MQSHFLLEILMLVLSIRTRLIMLSLNCVPSFWLNHLLLFGGQFSVLYWFE